MYGHSTVAPDLIVKLPFSLYTGDKNRRRIGCMKSEYKKWNRLCLHAPLVLLSTGGMDKAATMFYKRLSSMLSEKIVVSYSKTMDWL